MESVKRLGNLNLATCFAAGFCLLAPMLARSQDEGASGQGSGYSAPTELEEITVTARKRVENLQDVGLSVSAFSKQEIQNNYSTDVRDLVSQLL